MTMERNGMLETLPDILAPELNVVFVGINPSIYSVERGHYFARPTNRFWTALSLSRLSRQIRERLGREMLVPEDDLELIEDGFGFTDVVKIPTSSASQLKTSDFEEWAPRARGRIEHYAPRFACFQGVTALRPFLKYALHVDSAELCLGRQADRIGDTRIFLVPNPSPANAHYRLDDLTQWFDVLSESLGDE
jgi:TDG/mug DNA glycosylase family protein